jgi:nucleotide-binding universal stress UspA family protein
LLHEDVEAVMEASSTTRRPMRGSPRTILVATDFDACAEAALDEALALARPLGAKVYVFHAYSLPVAAFPGGKFAPRAEVAPKIVDAARASLHDAIDKRRQSGSADEVDLVPVLEEGDRPSEAVLAAVSRLGADLVVVGTHGRHGLEHALLGSVAESLVRSSPVPVLTVHAAGH